jgi:hypothetical protein
MLASAFDLGEELNNRKIRYILYKPLWERFINPGLNLRFETWVSIKYLNDLGTDLSTDVDAIPNDTGGLYLFFVKCHIVPGITEYPLYIGRAQKTEAQNLRKRVKEYWQHFQHDAERPKITRMIRYWGNYLHLAY